jgi:uncharacterized lipoprotein YmbA
MIRLSSLLLAFVLTLAGCGSAPPAPADRFYRLNAAPLAGKGLAGLVVNPLRADSLYAERYVAYSEDSGARQLRQYHYHLWLYPPGQLVQDYLITSLGAASSGDRQAAQVDGRVLRFDRLLNGKESRAVVAVELQLTRAGKVVLNKTYRAEQVAADSSMAAYVLATEQALAAIAADFARDAGN